MTRLTTLLLLTMLPATAGATPFVPSRLVGVARIALPGLRASCRPCADGFCAIVTFGRRSDATLAKLPSRRGAYWLQLEKRLRNTRLVVDSPRGVVRCHVTDDVLYLGRLHRRNLLAALTPRIVEASKLRQLQPIERLVAARQYQRATARLQKLDATPGASAFVQLRLADVQYLRGRLPTAYARYAILARGIGAGALEGALRAAALRFVIDGKQPSRALVSALHGAHGPLAASARRLMATVLAQSGQLDRALELVVSDPNNGASRALARRLASATIRRCRLAGNPRCGAVALYRIDPLLPKNARGRELRANGARAFLELGLPGEAQRQLQRVLRARPQSWLQERALRDLARAYAEQGDSFRALRTIAYYRSLYDHAAAAHELRVLRARLLIDRGRVKRLGRIELPLLLAARLQRALAVERGTADGPLWRRLAQLRDEQQKLQRSLARLRQERKP